ncbi:uncharacterized protein TNCV_4336431 [Trichonephila clavipes]|nr:uncharacterized protein TNCV_4336431 [Trichonephila clavipes]
MDFRLPAEKIYQAGVEKLPSSGTGIGKFADEIVLRWSSGTDAFELELKLNDSSTDPKFLQAKGTLNIVYYKEDFGKRNMPGKRARRHFLQLREFERGLIIGMKTAGWSTRRVAGQVDRSECAVRNCWEQ